ncbi:MAG: peptidase S53 [Terriglobia bacterium]|nr:MAG: peptidase S53 [Terriglobia bacterium]
MAQNYVPIAGSERRPARGARYLGPVNPQERVEVSVYLRAPDAARETVRESLENRRKLTHAEYAAAHAAHAANLEQVRRFAKDCNLSVLETDSVRGAAVLAGGAAEMAKAFGTELHYWQQDERTFRGRTGALHIPSDLAPLVLGVFGLDDRPQARPLKVVFNPQAAPGVATSHTAPAIARLYNFPAYGNGAGQTIGIIELGGGFRDADLQVNFSRVGLPVPPVIPVSVDGGSNSPGDDPRGDDAEVMLDIVVAGEVASGANIVVYFAPNSDRGFIDAVNTAVFDNVHRPSVISISWGLTESEWSQQSITAMDQAFQSAAALGITVFCSTGDNGSGDGRDDGRAHLEFPSSSPHVVACGGTHLETSGNTITSEVVWNSDHGATGGGISDVFGLPDYQASAGVPASANGDGRIGRGIPDISGDADPATGFQVRVDGTDLVIGGTSAVAPLWAGLMALINEQLIDRVGFVNPILYRDLIFEADVTRDITSGNNGAYGARGGWDACTGLGSPNGENWLAALIY